MKEKLTIRVLKSRINTNYDLFKEMYAKWITIDYSLVVVIQGYLDDSAFADFVSHLITHAGYNVNYIEREYSKEEVDKANVFTLSIDSTFEPTGEELGTKYIFTCSKCGGRQLEGPLKINPANIPKKVDIAKTIARDEWVVNERVHDIILSEKLSGVTLDRVESVSRKQSHVNWYHLRINSTANVSILTHFGDSFKPNVDIKSIKSECGHEIRDLIYSELFLDKSSWDGSDFCVTNYYFGGQSGVVYPFQYIVISKKAYDCLVNNKIKGYSVEIAHLV